MEGGNCLQMDCNDADYEINPAATEIGTDGIDNNCNNLTDAQDPNAVGYPVADCTDADGDHYAVEGGRCGPVDCDDGDSSVNPGEIEICDDGFDNNCNAYVDAVDATCQAMSEGDDEKLKDRHGEARRKRGDNDYEEDRKSRGDNDYEEDRESHGDNDYEEDRESRGDNYYEGRDSRRSWRKSRDRD
jgi:hypothetical protein